MITLSRLLNCSQLPIHSVILIRITNKGIMKASRKSVVSANDIQVGNDRVNSPSEEGVKV